MERREYERGWGQERKGKVKRKRTKRKRGQKGKKDEKREKKGGEKKKETGRGVGLGR